MIIDILIVLAFVVMGVYSIRSFYPLRVVSTVPKPVEKTDEVTAVERIEKKDKIGDYDAIVPSIQGWAKVYGYNKIIIDTDDDPFAHGFQVI